MRNILDSPSMKTSSVRSVVTPVTTSEKSCGSSAKFATPRLMYLDLTKASGSTTGVSWETVTALHGESWTPNTGVSPSVAVVSTLSSILGGGSAGKVLFEREGLQRNFEQIKETWQTVAADTPNSTTGNDSLVGLGCGVTAAFESHSQDARYKPLGEVCSTVTAQYGTGGNNMPIVINQPDAYAIQIRSGCEGGGKGVLVQTEKSATLSTVQTQTLFVRASSSANAETCENLSPTLTCQHDGPPIVYENMPPWIVRRLTPQECAMLQGFPPDWAADIPHSNSAEYKMWGNGMALPCVLYVIEGLAAELSKEAGDDTSS